MTATQRLGLVLLGTVVGNVGRTQLDSTPGAILLILGGTSCLVALGLLELSIHLWHTTRRRLAS
jgi:hypothetical protein